MRDAREIIELVAAEGIDVIGLVVERGVDVVDGIEFPWLRFDERRFAFENVDGTFTTVSVDVSTTRPANAYEASR